MKIKTSELTGKALDWAVAKCEGVHTETFNLFYEPTELSDYDSHNYPEFNYSTIWAQGGPIIERERITIWAFDDVTWRAQLDTAIDPLEAPTPLIAAMRCYVASKVGDEIEIPEEIK